MNTAIFTNKRFIIQHKTTDNKGTLEIADANMNPLCYVKHQHTWKTPKELKGIPVAGGMRTTDVRFEGIDGSLLGEITEVPVGLMRVIRKWLIYDEKQVFKGAVKEKPKFLRSDWVLENTEDNIVATIEGNRKKHDFEVLNVDTQVIARCAIINENSYEADILLSNLDPFLLLSYVVVLDLAKNVRIVTSSD